MDGATIRRSASGRANRVELRYFKDLGFLVVPSLRDLPFSTHFFPGLPSWANRCRPFGASLEAGGENRWLVNVGSGTGAELRGRWY